MAAEGEETQNQERLNYQCWLLSRWSQFQAKAPNSYGESFTRIMGNPSDVIHSLTAGKGREGFLNIDAAQFGLLVPRIKIFKIPLNQKGEQTGKAGVEIKFKTHYSESTISQLTSNQRSRGDGVGLKSLSYELYDAGSTELAARRQKITLKFYGESLAALKEAGVLDLAIPSEKMTAEYDDKNKLIPGSERPNSEYYGLKLVYGWAIPPEKTGFIGKGLIKALKSSVQTLILSLTDHTLTFAENGSTELECVYEAYADTKIGELNCNIIWSDAADKEAIKRGAANRGVDTNTLEAAEERIEAAKKDVISAKAFDKDLIGDSAEVTAAKGRLEAAEAFLEQQKGLAGKEEEALTEVKAEDKATKYSRLLEQLAKSNKIWAVNVKAADVRGRSFGADISKEAYDALSKEKKDEYDAQRAAMSSENQAEIATTPPGPNAAGNSAAAGAALRAQAAAAQQADDSSEDFSASNLANAPVSPDVLQIFYIYFGDLFAAVLETAYSGKTLPIQYLLGTLNFTDPTKEKAPPVSVNIANIPISMHLFEQFWMKNVIKPGRDTYTIKQFLRQALDELIVAALGDDCFPGGAKSNTSPTRVKMTTLTAPAMANPKIPRIKKGGIVHANTIAIPTSGESETTTSKKLTTYLLVYSTTWTSPTQNGNRSKDAERGIYHFAVGQDRGPIKRVSFEKMNIEFQQTAAAMRGGSTLGRLASAYKVKLTMIGNTIIMPGNFFYVAPTSMGMTAGDAKKLGLGGYYIATKMNGSVDSTGWTVEIEGTPTFSSTEDKKEKGPAITPAPVPAASTDADPEEKP